MATAAHVAPAVAGQAAHVAPAVAGQFGVTEEHAALAESVRRWAQHHAPIVQTRARVEEAASDVPTWWKALAEQGLLGLHLPGEQGGGGGGPVELAVVLAELAEALV